MPGKVDFRNVFLFFCRSYCYAACQVVLNLAYCFSFTRRKKKKHRYQEEARAENLDACLMSGSHRSRLPVKRHASRKKSQEEEKSTGIKRKQEQRILMPASCLGLTVPDSL